MRDADREGKLQLAMAIEQLRRIGFKGIKRLEVRQDGWFSRNKWKSKKQQEEFREWAIGQIRTLPRFKSKRAAEEAFAWFDLAYGLHPADEETRDENHLSI